MSEEQKAYGHTIEDLYEWVNAVDDKQAENAVKIGEMKDWTRYLSKGGLLEQIMEKVENLESVLKEVYLDGIETSKRHIKELRAFSMHLPDWNIYVVEEWRSIRVYKRALKKLGVGSARQTEKNTIKGKYFNCKFFELIKSIDKQELDKYYCRHKDNLESECEYASCPRNYAAHTFETSEGEKS